MQQTTLYSTNDLALAATLSLWVSLDSIDQSPETKRATFNFERSDLLNGLIEDYWHNKLQVEPQAFFNNLRNIKTRLYEGHNRYIQNY
jgi:hypothetical protein